MNVSEGILLIFWDRFFLSYIYLIAPFFFHFLLFKFWYKATYIFLAINIKKTVVYKTSFLVFRAMSEGFSSKFSAPLTWAENLEQLIEDTSFFLIPGYLIFFFIKAIHLCWVLQVLCQDFLLSCKVKVFSMQVSNNGT